VINPLPMVAADLRRHLASSLGILLLLSLAFSATVMVSLFERGFRRAGARGSADTDLVVGAAGSSLQLVLASVFLQTNEVLTLIPSGTVERLSADPRVAAVSPLVFADHWGGSPIVGVGPDFPRLKPRLAVRQGSWPAAPFEVSAGASAGVRLGQELESVHGSAEQPGAGQEHHADGHYRVVGILAPTGTPWDRGLFTPVESLWEIHGRGAGSPGEEGERGVSAVIVKPRSFADAYSLRAEYSTAGLQAVFPGEVLARLFGVFQDVKTAFTALAVLFQAIVFASVLLSLLASMPSRARWIGLLRALGAGRGYVFLTLWVQSAALFFLAVAAGALAGWAGAGILGGLVGGRIGLRIPISWSRAEAITLALFWAAGLAGALLPAWRAFRLSVRAAFLAA
jgi:putative ABC transport system permease protein